MFRKLREFFSTSSNSQRAVSRLLKQLDSTDPATRKDAEKALEATYYPSFPRNGPRIWKWDQHSKFVEQHKTHVRSSQLVIPLLEALAGKSLASRQFSIKALAANKEPRALDGIIAGLKDESSLIRVTAARSLLHYSDPRSVGPLIQALSDLDEECRQSAASTLGHVADPRANGPLLRLLESRLWRDRSAALYALGRTCDERSLPVIRRHLRDPAKRVRKAAKAALADYDLRRRETLARRRSDR